MAVVVVDYEDAGLQFGHGQYNVTKGQPIASRARVTFAPMLLRLALALLISLNALPAQAQGGKRYERDRQMSQEERQRMREDVRDAYRDRERAERPHQSGQRQARQQQMSAEERGKLRRDIEDANRSLKR